MKRWTMVLMAMFLFMVTGCGGGGVSSSSTNTNNNSLPAGKGAVVIDVQLFTTAKNSKSTLKVAAAVASGGAGGGSSTAITALDEHKLREKIHHADFWFAEATGYYGQMQTINVVDGALKGVLLASPGDYTLDVNFVSKSGVVLYRATTPVTIASGIKTPITLVAQVSPFVYLPTKINNPIGQFTDQTYYGIETMEIGGGFYDASSAQYNAEKKQLSFFSNYPTDRPNISVKMTTRDDNGDAQSANFTYDLLKAIDEADANGYVTYEWPAPGQIEVNVIFEADNAGFVKAVNAVPVATPTRGNNNTTLAKIHLANTATETAIIKKMTFRLWDANYLANMYLVRADLSQIIGSSTHFPVDGITIDEFGVAVVTFTTDIYIPAGAMVSINLQGDVSPNYPTDEMFNFQVTAASVVTETNQPVPFLGTNGMAVGIY